VKVAILLYQGFDDLDAVGPFEVLSNAAKAGADIEVRLVSAGPEPEVRSSHGMIVRPHDSIGAEADLDLVVVPGGGWNDRAEQGAWAEAKRGAIPDLIEGWHGAGARIASVCTGAGLVAAAGVAHGRPMSTRARARADLVRHGVEIVDARVVDDGQLLSAGGVTAGIDLGLWLVERRAGRALADRIAAEMEHERRGPVHRGPRSAPDEVRRFDPAATDA
jgi:transcriptional regulator GlxA family with amidase domain